MSWLKKGPVLGLLGGLLLVWAFLFFFFDPLLKRGLISAGQAAADAKVEISSLRTRWLKGELELKGIAIADSGEPMKNVIELSRAAFHLDLGAALRGKAVVREAALEGLRAGGARATSGALPRRPPPGKLQRLVLDKIAPPPASGRTRLGEVKANAAGEVDAAKLQSVRKLDEAKAKAKEVETRWKAKPDEAKAVEKESREIGEQLKGLGSGGSAPADMIRKASAAKAAQERIKGLIARVESQRAAAQQDLTEAASLVRQADELRGQDLNGLLAAAGLPTLDSQDLTRRLLGAQTAGRLGTALKWMRLAREKAAAKKSDAPPAPPRRRGFDVEFPVEHVYPQFLLEGAKLSGTLDGVTGGALDLQGLLNGVTSNPKLYGKPATLTLSGKSASGPAVRLDGRLDQQKNPVGVSVDFSGSGFSLAGAVLGDEELGGTLKSGAASARGRLASSGEHWSGEILVEAAGVVIEPKVALSGSAGRIVSEALRSLSAFRVKIGISGHEDDLKLSFSSNAGEAVAAAMRKAVSAEIDAQKKVLAAKIDAVYAGKRRELEAQTQELRRKLLGPLDAQKAALDKQLKEALSKAIGKPSLPKFDKLFR